MPNQLNIVMKAILPAEEAEEVVENNTEPEVISVSDMFPPEEGFIVEVQD